LRRPAVPLRPITTRSMPVGRRAGGAPAVARARTLPPEAEGNSAP